MSWRLVRVVTGGFCFLLLMVPSALSGNGSSASTATPIEHVIIIMQENHSFDNYFGTYPTGNGSLTDSITSRLNKVQGIPMNVCLPLGGGCVQPTRATSSSPSNPIEGQLIYEMDYSGNGTGFAQNSGPQSMVYFDYKSIAGYWDYAEEYGIGENYFAALLSQTTPNRLMLLAGDTPVPDNSGPPPSLPYSSTLMRQLDQAGVSWGYYDYLGAFGTPSNTYPLNYLSGKDESSDMKIMDVSRLYQQLSRGTGLPAVSFVNSIGSFNLTEHPPSNPTEGENWVVSVVNRIMESNYWNSTAIFITWDEGGGFYDHVVPPQGFVLDHDFVRPLMGLGQRVPLIVVSAYSRENYVSDTLLSHLSLLHFVEYNWMLPPLNSLVAGSNLPLDFFDFSQARRAPITLPQDGPGSVIGYPIPLQQVGSSIGEDTRPHSEPGLGGEVLVILAVAGVVAVLIFRLKREKDPNKPQG